MKLTLTEKALLTTNLTSDILEKTKPKELCVVTIDNTDNAIVCIEKFSTFRRDLKKTPAHYTDLIHFRFILTHLL